MWASALAGDNMTWDSSNVEWDVTVPSSGDVEGIDAGDNIRIDDPNTSTPEVNLAASPALTGSPTSTTPADNDDSTRIATTAWVLDNAGGGAGDVTGIDAGDGIRIDDPDTPTPEVNIANSAESARQPDDDHADRLEQLHADRDHRVRPGAGRHLRRRLRGLDAGDGIRIDDGATATPEVNIDIPALTVLAGDIADGDDFALTDASTSDVLRKVSAQEVADYVSRQAAAGATTGSRIPTTTVSSIWIRTSSHRSRAAGRIPTWRMTYCGLRTTSRTTRLPTPGR